MNLKKIMATVVALAMVLSSMGMIAFAETVTEVSTAADLKTAVEAGKSVKLTADITTDSALEISGQTVSIDLNEKTLKLGAGDNKFIDASTITISNGTINIDGLTVGGNAAICLDEYEKTSVTTLTLNDVDVVGENYSSAYCVFYIGDSSVLNVNGGNWILKNDLYEDGGVFKSDTSAATLNISGATMDFYNVRRGVIYTNTTIENSQITIKGDEETSKEMEHGFNRSPLSVVNSTITMENLFGRGITAECGAVTIDATSKVTMQNCVEATIDVRNNQTFTIEEGAKVVIDKKATVASGATIVGTVEIGTPAVNYLAKIGDTSYETVAAALAAAQEASMTDVTITLCGETTKESAIALEDTFNLYTKNGFNSVTFKQEDPSKVYYIDSIYTGSRTNGGECTFDGVNIVVTGQYIFEGNVKLTGNSVVKSVAEDNCFVYNGTTTVELGSKLQGVIEDIRSGALIIDGGRTDGAFNETPDMQDAIIIINWSGDSMTLKNGAYFKVNAANEIGTMTVNAGTNLNVYDSKLDAWQWIANNGTINTDVNSLITTGTITGTGVINIDASDMAAEEVLVIDANMSGFNGIVNVTGNDNATYEITDDGIVVSQSIVVEETILKDAVNSKAQASGLMSFTGETSGIKWCSYKFIVDMTGKTSIGVTVEKDGAQTKSDNKTEWVNTANIESDVAFGVAVTGLASLDTITVDVQ